VIADGATSVGDALREVDKSGLVTNDFVLITADVVSNADLTDVIQKHKERKASDKQMAMTVVFRRDGGGSGGHRSGSPLDEVLVACDADSNKILHFQRSHGKGKINLPVDVLQADGDVELRYDLLDPGIAICSPIVPQIFSDDFDYLTRDDFIKGLLVHQEIMGNSLYLSTIDDSYAARAFDLATYNAISRDVVGRWTYPLTPDLFPPKYDSNMSSKCRYGHGCVYRSSNVSLGPKAVLSCNTVVGNGTKIGAKSVVRNSIIGNNCVIGENVELDGVFLMDGVTVGSRSRATHCVLAAEVTLDSGVTLEPGCVLGSKVKIGAQTHLPSGTELTVAEDHNEDGVDQDLVGPEGFGFRFVREEDSDDEEDEEEEDEGEDATLKKLAEDFWWKTKLTNADSAEVESSSSSEEEEDDDDEDDADDDGDAGVADGDDDVADDDDEEMKDLKQFHSEVIDTLLRGVEENISSDNLVLEINSLKQAYFIYISEVQQCVVKCVLEAPIAKLSLSGKALLLHVRKHGFPLLKNYVKDSEAQRLALVALADLCCGGAGGAGSAGEEVARRSSEVLTPLLGMLYNEDIIVDSEVVFDWYGEQSVAVKKLFVPFVKNLKEAEEEEEEEDDDDDEDDEDE